jgi:hypothetical protein
MVRDMRGMRGKVLMIAQGGSRTWLWRLEICSLLGSLPVPEAEAEAVRCNSCALSALSLCVSPGLEGEYPRHAPRQAGAGGAGWGTHWGLALIVVWSNKILFVDTLVYMRIWIVFTSGEMQVYQSEVPNRRSEVP